MATISVNGTDLAIRREGAGAPVLFVHGSASDARTWEAQIGPVAKTFEAIVYSRRHHRPNPDIAPGGIYAMAEHVEDLLAVIEALGRGAVHLVGHSYGGVLALIAAIRRPGQVASLVLEEPPAFNIWVSDPPCPAELLRLMLRRPRLALALLAFGARVIGPATKAARHGDREKMARIFGRGVLGREAFAALPSERRRQAMENSPPEELLGPGFVRLDEDAARGVTCPALVVAGGRSPAMFRLIAEELCALLPCAERVDIEDASHMVHEDDAAGFNAALLDFLGRQGAEVGKEQEA